jgi:hypothetical protein
MGALSAVGAATVTVGAVETTGSVGSAVEAVARRAPVSFDDRPRAAPDSLRVIAVSADVTLARATMGASTVSATVAAGVAGRGARVSRARAVRSPRFGLVAAPLRWVAPSAADAAGESPSAVSAVATPCGPARDNPNAKAAAPIRALFPSMLQVPDLHKIPIATTEPTGFERRLHRL